MACPFCGEQCTCLGEHEFAHGAPAVLLDPESQPSPGQGALYAAEEIAQWKQEVASRVDAFCARRGRKRYERSSSLSLDFERAARATAAAHFAVPEPQFEPTPPTPAVEPQDEASNLIEFPKPPLAPPEAPRYFEELAEAILDKPRILDAEEPSGLLFGGEPMPSITLEPKAEELVAERDCGPAGAMAPLGLRAVAAVADSLLLMTASALFGLIFLRLAGAAPRTRLALVLALVVPAMLWAMYQYLFLVYAAATPGMRLAGLQVVTFDGEPARRRLRRWRALALVVSCMSLGLGFFWAAIDDYGLCWHDRITRTCVRSSKQ